MNTDNTEPSQDPPDESNFSGLIGLEVRHRDGTSGKIVAALQTLPARVRVRFTDGVISNQLISKFTVAGEPLESYIAGRTDAYTLVPTVIRVKLWKERILPALSGASKIDAAIEFRAALGFTESTSIILEGLNELPNPEGVDSYLRRLDRETRLAYFCQAPILAQYRTTVIAVLTDLPQQNVSVQRLGEFWRAHPPVGNDAWLLKFAPPSVFASAWIEHIFPSLTADEQAAGLVQYATRMSASDWRRILKVLLAPDSTSSSNRSALACVPAGMRLDYFAGIIELESHRFAVLDAINTWQNQNGQTRHHRHFWDRHRPHTPFHWLFCVAPLDLKRRCCLEFFKDLVAVLNRPFDEADRTKSWRPSEIYPKLDNNDERLASQWSSAGAINRAAEMAKMLSARAAEKCVKQLYEELGWKVVDTSIQQLDGASRDWVTHDLDVKGYGPIDVKNARLPANSTTFYVEHCVKQFKRDAHNSNVRIAGMLSPYLKLEYIRAPEAVPFNLASITYLGETSFPFIDELARAFTTSQMEIYPPHEGFHVIAPWYFDYPATIYGDTLAKQIQRIANLSWPAEDCWDYLFSDMNPRCLLPALLLLNRPIPDPFKQGLHEWEVTFYEYLRVRRKDRFSLPVIFLSVLTHFLQQIGGDVSGFSPKGYSAFFFKGASRENIAKRSPLGLTDPTETVANLIDTLEILWEHRERTNLVRFSRFRLYGLGLLRGYDETASSWATIVAYCGGSVVERDDSWNVILGQDRKPMFMGKCGFFPLIIGREKLCEDCGKLICNHCGFCSEVCFNRHITKQQERRNIRVVKVPSTNWPSEMPPDDEFPPIDIYVAEAGRSMEEDPDPWW